jgi:pimeloyl-ACP methyl ester carboxylesterase
MAFEQQSYHINGIHTAVLTAGEGDPLVFLHGAGTLPGFDPLLPLAEHHRLIIPVHPGFGSSDDDPSIDSVHDYRRHYLDLFDQLGIDRAVVVGHSMGGYLAGTLAIDHPGLVTRLVLAAPLGLKVAGHPTTDLFTVPPAEIGAYLTEKPSLLAESVPDPPTPEHLADQYREMTSAARLLWESPYDRKLDKWLHRVTMPALVLWGEADRLIPVGQCPEWTKRLPAAEQRVLPGVGHLLFHESQEAVDAVRDFAAS